MTPADLQLQLHHTGVLVKDLPRSLAYYREYFGYQWDGQVYHDPTQQADIAWLTLAPGPTRLELIYPTAETALVAGAAKRRERLLHLCYSVADLPQAIACFRKLGSMPVSGPYPAVAFGGAPVCFLLTRDRELIELVQLPPTPG